MGCHSVCSMRRLLSSLRILPLLSRLGGEVASLQLVILVPPVVVRLSGEAPTLPARMTRFCIIEVPCFGAQGIIPSTEPRKRRPGRGFHRGRASGQGTLGPRGGAGSRGTRQPGPKDPPDGRPRRPA